MPVTQNRYLVGRIVETNLSSRVLLLNGYVVEPVTFDEKNTQAILTGGGTVSHIGLFTGDYQFVENITVFASGKMEFLMQAHQ